jgi:Dyp-type peroxidase family
MTSLHELARPISQDELKKLLDDPRKPLASLQGNILKSHGREQSACMFLRFKAGKMDDVKNWIRKFSERVTSAQQQFYDAAQHRQSSGPGPLFINFFLSAKGYEHLFPNIRIGTRFNDKAFLYGMRAAQHRLNDPPRGRMEQGFQHTIDGMVLLAHAEESSLRQAEDSLAKAIQAHTEICVVEHGRMMRNAQNKPTEHFGFVDSSSQPLFFEKDVEQETQTHQASDWNPGAGPNIVLVADPFGRRECDCGSYLVFRKLEQNVRGFKTRERQLANALGLVGADAKRAGALVMGRFDDGTPLALHSVGGHPDNNFTYADDPDGGKCPIQAHIRKINPRQAETPRIVRRGITYGERAKEPKDNPSDDEWPSEGVGLLFMCYQRSIVQQFEVLQYLWANDPRLPWEHRPGIDPVIGQPLGNSVGQHKWPAQWNDPREKHKPFNFHGYVTFKGGEYFFAPSIFALAHA